MAEKKTGSVFDGPILRRLLRYARPYRRWFFLALGLTVLLAVFEPLRAKIIEWLLDGPVIEGDIPGVRRLILMLFGLLTVQSLLTYGNTYLTAWLGQSVIRDIRQQTFRHILRLRPAFFDKNPIGKLQTRAISDIETLNDVFSSNLVRILGESFLLISILAFMFLTSWELTLVVLVTVPLMFLATWIFKRYVKSAFQAVRESVSNMNTFLQEHISGMNIIHIFSREKIEGEKYDGINRRLRKAHLRSVMAYSIFYPVVEIITSLGLALLVWYGAGQILEGRLAFGELTAFIIYLNMFFRPIRTIADQFNTLQLGIVSAERVFKILDTNEYIEAPELGTEELSPAMGVGLPVTFEQVSFAYNPPEYVLRDISFEVQAGETTALVGATGSGKTTIINLLSRFYDIQEGSIRIDGRDVREYSLESLRRLIGVVLQDVFLFSGSIRDNITLSNDGVSQELVEQAARRVGAHEFICDLPGGYDYNVRERGATLSLGQRQLIAFARVLIYDPSILVLDEATANIDTESEEIIQHAIDTVMAGRTAIIIAHRLSTIQKADQIVVLSKGKILEKGTHRELVAGEGAYRKLYDLQFA